MYLCLSFINAKIYTSVGNAKNKYGLGFVDLRIREDEFIFY